MHGGGRRHTQNVSPSISSSGIEPFRSIDVDIYIQYHAGTELPYIVPFPSSHGLENPLLIERTWGACEVGLGQRVREWGYYQLPRWLRHSTEKALVLPQPNNVHSLDYSVNAFEPWAILCICITNHLARMPVKHGSHLPPLSPLLCVIRCPTTPQRLSVQQAEDGA